MKYLDRQFEPYEKLAGMCANDSRALTCINALKIKKKYNFMKSLIKMYFIVSFCSLIPFCISNRNIIVCLGLFATVSMLGLLLCAFNWVGNGYGGKVSDLSYLNWYLGENAFSDISAEIRVDSSGKDFITIVGNKVYLGNFYFPNYNKYLHDGVVPVRIVYSVNGDGSLTTIGKVMGIEDRVVIWKGTLL